MSTKVCLIVQGSFTVTSETLPCSGGYDMVSTTGAHSYRNSMIGNSFIVDSETSCDTVACVCGEWGPTQSSKTWCGLYSNVHGNQQQTCTPKESCGTPERR